MDRNDQELARQHENFLNPDHGVSGGILAKCGCGCKSIIEADDCYIRIEDDYFIDSSCVMIWLQKEFDVEIVD
jgi:hypothetical protein